MSVVRLLHRQYFIIDGGWCWSAGKLRVEPEVADVRSNPVFFGALPAYSPFSFFFTFLVQAFHIKQALDKLFSF